MKDCIRCGMICLAVGMVIGGIVVAKNKKLAYKIDQSTTKASDALSELKEDMEQKIEDLKQKAEQMKEENSEKTSATLNANKKKN